MSRPNRKTPFFALIVVLLSISHFGRSFAITEVIDFTVLDQEIAQRVDDLMASGKYDLSYFTDFTFGANLTYADSTKAMVASSDIRCSRVGAYYLENGGNMIDAAVATSICINVIEIASSGFTGGGASLFLLNGRVQTLDFAPYPTKSIVNDEDIYEGGSARALKIPGMAMGLYQLWQKGGKIEWKSLFDIPILIAYNGWEVKPSLRRQLVANEFPLSLDPFLKQILFNGNVVKSIGDRIVNKPLTRTLHLLSMDYKNMYFGAIPSLMMNQIGQKYYDSLMSEISQYQTRVFETMSLDLNDEKKMVTIQGNHGGSLAAYIINAIRGYKNARPEVFHGDGTVDDSYYVTLYDILNNGHILMPNAEGDKAIQLIKDAYNNYTNDVPTIELPAARKLTKAKESLLDSEYKEEEDIPGSSSVVVFDECGNAISMKVAINQLFGGVFSFPELGLVANTYTGVKLDENLKPIPINTTHRFTFSSPILVVGKSDNRIYQIYSGTGGRKIASAVAQVLANHFYINMPMGVSSGHFRMFSPFDDNYVHAEEERPIPVKIVDLLAQERGVSVRVIPYHYMSSVTQIGVTRDAFGYPVNIFGQGDFRRNGGVKGV